MKFNLSLFLYICLLACSISGLQAQNTSPFWSLAGNNNATATSKLGTTNAIPLRLFTNNSERVRIQTNGWVGIGTTNPLVALTVKSTVGTPGNIWVSGSPVFYGFTEAATSELNLGAATNTPDLRPVFAGKRSRGTLAAPQVVVNNDYIVSYTGAAFDGGRFQFPAGIQFYVDGTPSAGHVPARISFETGTTRADRKERLKILNNGDFDFNSGQVFLQQSTGFLGVSTNGPQYPLHVEGGNNNSAIYGHSNVSGVYGLGGQYGVEGYSPGGLGFGIGVYGHSSYTGVSGSAGSYGVSGYCTSTSSGYGVFGSATNNASGIGVYGQGYYGVRGISNSAYGVDGTGYYVGVVGHGSSLNSSSFGTEGYGESQGAGGYFTGGHAGVIAYASTNSSSNFGVYGSGNGSAYAGYFNGTVLATTFTNSDQKLKKNIEDVKTALDIIGKLRPKVYEFRQDGSYQYMHMPEGKHYGLIAQELEQILPGMVKETKFDTRIELEAQQKAQSNGDPQARKVPVKGEVIDFKAVNYTELIPIIIKGMQEQENEMSQLKAEIEDLKSIVKNLSQSGGSKLLYARGFLGQNVPNPADGTTTIAYSVLDNETNGEIRITDMQGRLLKSYPVSGQGQLSISRGFLAAGVYNYSLYSGGQLVQTKQMTIAR